MKTGSTTGSLSVRLLQAQDEERRRISRDLHDSVGQALVAARMCLGRVIRTNRKSQNTDLQECLELVERALQEVRSVSYLLHPPMLDLIGLGAAVRGYVEGFNKRSDITLHVEMPEKLPRLSLEKETAAFRIVQECLTNVYRYSGASNAWVRINSSANEFRLEVQDDGKGIATRDIPSRPESELSLGVGIPGMRERVRELGGSLEIQSSRPGTRVVATVPLDEHESEQASTDEIALSVAEPKRAGNRAAVVDRRSSSRNRILIVEDHELMRRGIRALIENQRDLEVCGEAGTALEAIHMTKRLRPDIILLDLQLPDSNGWEVVRGIRKFEFWTRVLIFTTHSYQVVANAARRAKCEGCLTKSQASDQLIIGLRAVLNGQTFYQRGNSHR